MDVDYFVVQLLAAEEIEERRQNRARRIHSLRLGAFEMEEVAFMARFRLPRALVLALIEDLRPSLPVLRRPSSLSVEVMVLTALRFYAVGSYQRSVGKERTLSISQKSVSRCIRRVSTAMNTLLLARWVKFPTTPLEQASKKAMFNNKYHLSGVVGAIDCTHVKISPPPMNHPIYPEHIYVNHHGSHSLNVQLVCDEKLEILNVVANHPGRSHDSHIWRGSRLREGMMSQHALGNKATWLIGDSGYPLEPWLMTPTLHAVPGSPEARYYRAHCAARNVIERLNGAIKSRWRCINGQRTLNYMPPIASKIVTSCVVLHNIATFHRVPLPAHLPHHPVVVLPPAAPAPGPNHLLAQGRATRNHLIATYFH